MITRELYSFQDVKIYRTDDGMQPVAEAGLLHVVPRDILFILQEIIVVDLLAYYEVMELL